MAGIWYQVSFRVNCLSRWKRIQTFQTAKMAKRWFSKRIWNPLKSSARRYFPLTGHSATWLSGLEPYQNSEAFRICFKTTIKQTEFTISRWIILDLWRLQCFLVTIDCTLSMGQDQLAKSATAQTRDPSQHSPVKRETKELSFRQRPAISLALVANTASPLSAQMVIRAMYPAGRTSLGRPTSMLHEPPESNTMASEFRHLPIPFQTFREFGLSKMYCEATNLNQLFKVSAPCTPKKTKRLQRPQRPWYFITGWPPKLVTSKPRHCEHQGGSRHDQREALHALRSQWHLRFS